MCIYIFSYINSQTTLGWWQLLWWWWYWYYVLHYIFSQKNLQGCWGCSDSCIDGIGIVLGKEVLNNKQEPCLDVIRLLLVLYIVLLIYIYIYIKYKYYIQVFKYLDHLRLVLVVMVVVVFLLSLVLYIQLGRSATSPQIKKSLGLDVTKLVLVLCIVLRIYILTYTNSQTILGWWQLLWWWWYWYQILYYI